jgi:hypothetical protein
MPVGVEPYGPREVERLLARIGAVMLPQTGGGQRVYELPTGATVKVPNPNGKKSLATDAARRIADAIGQSYAEFRSAVGHPITAAGRPHPTPDRAQNDGATGSAKQAVLSNVRDVRQLLTAVEHATRKGISDPTYYRRVHDQLVEVKRQAAVALAIAERKR